MGEIAVPTDPFQTFQTKVIDKLKADIGAMLPDAVLEGLVKRAVEEQFFQERVITTGSGYYTNKQTVPSLFVTAVVEAAKPLIDLRVKEFVEANHHLLEKALANFLTDHSLLLTVMAQLRMDTEGQLQNLRVAINALADKAAQP